MTRTYVAPEVQAVLDLHPYLTEAAFQALPIRDQIARQAETLHAAYVAKDPRVRMEVMSWWPKAQGRPVEQVLASDFTDADAALTLAREYGFADWDAVRALGEMTLDPGFETALDHIIAGDLAALRSDLRNSPQLATARTPLGHQSTLLHYLGANGVETHRQQTPLNAVALAELLIAHGASKTAEAFMYGGGHTPHALASTSAHPYRAGIADALNRALQPD